jgi:hypothetical protein
MVKFFLFAALAASASAFAPSNGVASKTSIDAFAGGMVGNEGPEPMPFSPGGTSKDFDPLGLSTVRLSSVMETWASAMRDDWISPRSCPQGAPEWLPWFREAELKHGRAAMLATVGFVVPEFVRVPGEAYSFEALPRVIDAHDALPDSMIQIFGWISFIEAVSFPALANMNEFDRKPGDFSFDPLGLWPKDEEAQKAMQLKELKNGRLAMVGIGGMVAGAVVSGHGFPYLP